MAQGRLRRLVTRRRIRRAVVCLILGGVMAVTAAWGCVPTIIQSGQLLVMRLGDTCYPDCDQSTGVGVLDLFDFLCFQNSFVRGEPYACDCDPDPACDIFDFLCFQNAFVGGCP